MTPVAVDVAAEDGRMARASVVEVARRSSIASLANNLPEEFFRRFIG
jgi:hypothetical protein